MVQSATEEILDERRELVTMLFSEGNHFCPCCEKSGNCQLQALAYDLEILAPRHNRFFPDRPVDASHPDILLDFNRCIFCELCIRASRDVDKKNVFALGGRGINKHLVVNAESERLVDTNLDKDDLAANICPVGVILHKRQGFAVPIGERIYDKAADQRARSRGGRGGAFMSAKPKKLRVATVSLAGCFGCHTSFLDIDERFFDLLEHVEFDRSPLNRHQGCGSLRYRPR